MSNHTPGPWTVAQGDTAWHVAPAGTDSTVIAEVGTTVRSGTIARAKASQANASLISAAPDMLAALLEALPILESYKYSVESKGEAYDNKTSRAIYAVEHVKAAIAKAEGRG